MNKRITALLLSVVTIISLLVATVPVWAEPADSGVSASVTQASPGETFSVTLKVPGTTKPINEMSLKVHFNKTVFEVTEYTAPEITGMDLMQSNLSDANSNGFFSATYDSKSSDADVEFSGLELTAKFKVKDGAAAGDQQFTISEDVSVGSLDSSGLPDILMGAADFAKQRVAVKVVAAQKPATAIALNKSTLALNVGDTDTSLEATVTPADTTDTVQWESDNEPVAVVDATGKVTAVSPGTAKITVKAGDKFADCTVTVEAAPCTHGSKTPVPEQESTCKEKGWDEYQICDECNKMFDKNGNAIDGIPYRPLKLHNYTSQEKKADALISAGNCRDEAVYRYSCAVCHEVEPNNDTHTFKGDKDPSNHVGGTTKVNAAEPDHANNVPGYTGDTKCNGCGEILETGSAIPAGTHVPADTWTTDETNHWKVCNVVGCGVVIESSKAAHSSTGANVATCRQKAVCDVCGVPYGELAAHNPGTEWKNDEDGHWHECQTEGCNEKLDYGTHTPDHEGGATYDYAVKCTVCGRELEAMLQEDTVRVELPFKLTVKKTGEMDPGKETFKFVAEDFGAHFEATIINDVVETDGEKTYNGTYIFKLSRRDMGNLSEGFVFRQVKGNAEGWTYDEKAYYAVPVFVDGYGEPRSWAFYKTNEDNRFEHESDPMEEITFTNSYNAKKPANQPGKPTGDSGTLALWLALAFVTGTALAGTVYFRKRKMN